VKQLKYITTASELLELPANATERDKKQFFDRIIRFIENQLIYLDFNVQKSKILSKKNFGRIDLATPLHPIYKFNLMDLSGMNLSGKKFGEQCSFYCTNLEGVNFTESTFLGCRFHFTNLTNVNFTEATITKTIFVYANVTGVTFSKTIMSGIIANKMNFSHIHFKDGCEIRGSNFYGSNFTSCNFDNADLENNDFSGTDFTSCNFDNAKLYKVNFTGAKLERADFSKVTLFKVDLNGIKFDEHTKFPPLEILQQAEHIPLRLLPSNLPPTNQRVRDPPPPPVVIPDELDILPEYDNFPDFAIDLDSKGVDVIYRDGGDDGIKISEFIKENDENDGSVIIEVLDTNNNSKIYLFETSIFRDMVLNDDSNNALVHPCRVADSLPFHSFSDDSINADKTVDLVSMANLIERRFLVTFKNLKAVFHSTPEKNKFMKIKKTAITIPSIASHNVIHAEGSYMSGLHCNAGDQPEQLWKVFLSEKNYIEIEKSSEKRSAESTTDNDNDENPKKKKKGGKKRTNKKTRKNARRVRRTHKRKHKNK
jgi:uncharacterized protein YjbI with pentapeptide repeats